MYPHRMRLLGPWQFEPLAPTVVHPDGRINELSGPLPEPGRMKIPSTWRGTPLDGFLGRVRWRRNFHPPRSLEPDERLWIVFEGVDYFADVSLNGTPLGRHESYFEPFEFEVTSLVGPHNELVVDVDCPAEALPGEQRMIRGSRGRVAETSCAGIWQDVALEVRSVAFLRDVLIQTEVEGSTGSITATGTVIGEPGVAFGLDLSVGQQRKAGQKLEATAAGVDFRLEAVIDSAELWWPQNLGTPAISSVELELHGKARTLDLRRRTVGFRRLVFEPDRASAELNGRRFPVMDLDLDVLTGEEGIAQADAKKWDDVVQRLSQSKDCLVLARTAGEVLAPSAYDTADSRGLFLWQGFPLCGGYSTDRAFRAEATRQAAAMVRQLAHHPSIALWSCHADPSEQDRELDEAVRAAIARLDSSRVCLM